MLASTRDKFKSLSKTIFANSIRQLLSVNHVKDMSVSLGNSHCGNATVTGLHVSTCAVRAMQCATYGPHTVPQLSMERSLGLDLFFTINRRENCFGYFFCCPRIRNKSIFGFRTLSNCDGSEQEHKAR